MSVRKLTRLGLIVSLVIFVSSNALAQQPQTIAERRDSPSAVKKDSKKTPPAAVQPSTSTDAAETAAEIRRVLPVLPALIRGDGLLSPFGQRATQNAFVSGANVK